MTVPRAQGEPAHRPTFADGRPGYAWEEGADCNLRTIDSNGNFVHFRRCRPRHDVSAAISSVEIRQDGSEPAEELPVEELWEHEPGGGVQDLSWTKKLGFPATLTQMQLDDCHRDSSAGVERAKIYWAKALWYATQEARRRKSQDIIDKRIARESKYNRSRSEEIKSSFTRARRSLSIIRSNQVAPGEGEAAEFCLSSLSPQHCVNSSTPKQSSQQHWTELRSKVCSKPASTLEKIIIHDSGKSPPMLSSSHQRDSNLSSKFAASSSSSLNDPEPRSNFAMLWTSCDKSMKQVLHSSLYLYMTTVCTCWVLFGADVYILQDPPMHLDKYVYSLYLVAAVQFMADLILRGIWETGYRFSFFFWLDFIALCSLIPEVVFLLTGFDIFDAGISGFARTGRAASAGARILRILRVAKLLKQIYEVRRKRVREPANEIGDTSASDVAKKLEAYVTMIVIIAVGAVLALSMALSIAYLCNEETVLDTTFRAYVHALSKCTGEFPDQKLYPSGFSNECIETWKARHLQDMIQTFSQAPVHHPVVFMAVSNVTLYGSQTDHLEMFREKPRSYIIRSFHDLGVGSGQGTLHVGNKQGVHNEARSQLLTVSSVLCVIWALSFTLTNSMRKEIVGPLERIVKIIEDLPGGEANSVVGKQEAKTEDKHIYEIEKAILRVGKLLKLGLGEAGTKIISTSMKEDDLLDNKGEVVQAIFGFCDMRNFTDCTEVLGADIVKLVNNIARHIHKCTLDNYGAPNKNIGDAFLLVWKPKGNIGISTVADASLRTYVRAIIQMQMCPEMLRWEKKSALQKRMPGFQVRLGFGLHYGWAVEGAIGSLHKIDASYLSAHVNMAARLEAATKQYGTAILLSESVYVLMSPRIRMLCRLVDRVTVKGSSQPVSIYTYDVPDIQSRGGTLDDSTNVMDLDMDAGQFLTEVVTPSTSPHFRQLHKRAMDFYLGGPQGLQADWHKAKFLLKKCLEIRPQDGPCMAVLAAIQSLTQEDGTAPEAWPGFRPLISK